MNIFLSQQSTTEELIHKAGLSEVSSSSKSTLYRSEFPVHKIVSEHIDLPMSVKLKLEDEYRSLVGSLNWLTTRTRPDIATITNMLSAYLHNATHSHLSAAKNVIKYLTGTSDFGICFSTKHKKSLEAFVKFPIEPSKIVGFSDANWGPQDASVPKPNTPEVLLDLFKSRSLSGYLLWLGGPLHWSSKRQTITARSSAEADIYATDECYKVIQHVNNIISDLKVSDLLIQKPIKIFNDNEAAVKWSRNLTTKGLRHLQMRENAVRELYQNGHIMVLHISGALNSSDMFTKEDKYAERFLTCRDTVMI